MSAKTKNIPDRKDKVEMTLVQMQKLVGTPEAALAWERLCREMSHMIDPEAKSPRFNPLLRTIWVAATNEQS